MFEIIIIIFHFTVGKLHGWRIFANSPFKNGRKPAGVNQSDEKQVYGRTGFIWFHKFQQWSPCINGHASIKWQSHTRFNPGKLLKKVMTGFSFSEYPRTSEANGWNSSKWTRLFRPSVIRAPWPNQKNFKWKNNTLYKQC